jgi:hypothetical protein
LPTSDRSAEKPDASLPSLIPIYQPELGASITRKGLVFEAPPSK